MSNDYKKVAQTAFDAAKVNAIREWSRTIGAKIADHFATSDFYAKTQQAEVAFAAAKVNADHNEILAKAKTLNNNLAVRIVEGTLVDNITTLVRAFAVDAGVSVKDTSPVDINITTTLGAVELFDDVEALACDQTQMSQMAAHFAKSLVDLAAKDWSILALSTLTISVSRNTTSSRPENWVVSVKVNAFTEQQVASAIAASWDDERTNEINARHIAHSLSDFREVIASMNHLYGMKENPAMTDQIYHRAVATLNRRRDVIIKNLNDPEGC